MFDWREVVNDFSYNLTWLHRRLFNEVRGELKRRFLFLRLKQPRQFAKERLKAPTHKAQLA